MLERLFAGVQATARTLIIVAALVIPARISVYVWPGGDAPARYPGATLFWLVVSLGAAATAGLVVAAVLESSNARRPALFGTGAVILVQIAVTYAPARWFYPALDALTQFFGWDDFGPTIMLVLFLPEVECGLIAIALIALASARGGPVVSDAAGPSPRPRALPVVWAVMAAVGVWLCAGLARYGYQASLASLPNAAPTQPGPVQPGLLAHLLAITGIVVGGLLYAYLLSPRRPQLLALLAGAGFVTASLAVTAATAIAGSPLVLDVGTASWLHGIELPASGTGLVLAAPLIMAAVRRRTRLPRLLAPPPRPAQPSRYAGLGPATWATEDARPGDL